MNAAPRSRDKLVASSLTLFADKGFEAVTEEELLKFSEVSRGILVYHFTNKYGLLQEIFRQYQDQVTAILPQEPHLRGVQAYIHSWLDALEAAPQWWKCYFRLYLQPESRSLLEGFGPFRQVFTQYQQGVQAALARSDDPAGRFLAFEALRLGLSLRYLDSPEDVSRELLQQAWVQSFR